jgi:DNA-directed RNA polymerase
MCKDAGINDFSMIHDSYGVHCCDTELLGNTLRQAFVAQYSVDVLGNFRDEIVEQLVNSGAGDLVKKIPELPEYGTLDLSVVLDSEYFFA